MHKNDLKTATAENEDAEDTDTRSSRRLRNLPPELGPLPDPTRPRKDASTATMSTPQSPTPVMLQQPRVPPTFHGYAAEDPEEWLDQFERVATINRWDEEMKLRYVYFSLDGPAKTWYENHETTLTTWEFLKNELLRTFTSIMRKERAQLLLESRTQQPNETLNVYVEEMKRLFRRADQDMTEDKKVGYLMRGVKESLFAGLIRNPPKTVAEFTEEAHTIERTLDARTRQYNRPFQLSSLYSEPIRGGLTTNDLREAIREVVKEELRRLLPPTPQPPQGASLLDIVRDEVQQALGSSSATTRTEAEAMTYAAAVNTRPPRRNEPSPRRYAAAPSSRPPLHAHPEYERRPSQRKCDTWRTPDDRPLCFHCGEAGHILRHCPYRRMGLHGFSSQAPRPRPGQRPPAIEDYLRHTEYLSSRSPSPPSPRFTSPNRSNNERRRSPSPRRGN